MRRTVTVARARTSNRPRAVRRRLVVFVLLAALSAWTDAAAPVRSARAQTLDLDGTREAPAIPTENAAIELARVLEDERAKLAAESQRLTGEARAAAEAKVKLRQAAVMLLQGGAARAWNRSAPVVFGLRLANLLARADRVADAAAAGTRVADGAPLAPVDARAALAALSRLAQSDLGGLRAAIAGDESLPEPIARSLRELLAPLAEIGEIAEGARIEDAWPVVASTTLPATLDRIASTVARGGGDLRTVEARVGALPAGAQREAAKTALRATAAAGIADGGRLRAIEAACEALAFTESVRAGQKPLAIEAAALEAIDAQVARALTALASVDPSGRALDEGAMREAVANLDALRPSLDAANAMLRLRGESWVGDAARRALSAACADLCASTPADSSALASRTRSAQRIAEACAAAEYLARAEADDAPRDLKDVIRLLDRDARFAVRALPAAFAELAGDPARSADPAALSALVRVTGLAADRARIGELQVLIDRIGGVQPKSGRAFAAVARRLARMLLDPLKRSEAQVAFASIEAQADAALPLAFEEELLRGTPRASTLTDGRHAKVAETAAAVRVAWTEAIGAGDFGGVASRRLDLVARYAAALRDLAQMTEPITREQGDRLATWGGWAARRALLAPAAVDLDARAVLASRSLLAMGPSGDMATFTRDLESLEQGLPLVRLAARLERTIGPSLRSDPTTMAAMLGPLVQSPAPDALLAGEWNRLMTLDRAMFESEFARRKGIAAYRTALLRFMATLSADIEAAAFGTRPKVGAVPGFDGSAPSQKPTGRQRQGDRQRTP